jgi:hypothetical protein
MKKLFLPAVVIAAIAIASCSKQDDGAGAYLSGESMPLSFSTFVGKSGGANTKAAIGDPDIWKTNTIGFLVWAYNTNDDDFDDADATGAANLMSNQQVKWESGAWTYSPTKYWPVNGGKVSFFAMTANVFDGVLPKDVENVELEPSGGNLSYGTTFDFTVNDDIAQQVDMVVAEAVDQKYTTVNGGKVSLNFNHILSRIGFNAKMNAIAGASIKVTDVVIKTTGTQGAEIINKGTYTQKPTLADGNWSLGSTALDISSTDVLTSTSEDVPSDGTTKPLHDTDKFLMLIPQKLKANSLAITITYQITSGGAMVEYTTTKTLPAGDLTIEIGKAYTFNLNFDLKSIIFETVSIGSWGSPTSSDTDL